MSSPINKALASILVVGFCLVSNAVAIAAAPADQMVNPQLAKRMELYKPELIQVGERVHAAFGYSPSNYGYIEGDDGIIVIDSGWYPGESKRSINDYRKLVPDKPIAAIIYTHLHLDHTGGAVSIMEGQTADIPIYGPKGWQQWVDESFSNLGPAMNRRITMQFGLALPLGESGTVGIGAGPAAMIEGESRLAFPPTVDIDKPTEVTIAGVRLQIIPQEGDLPEHLFVWLPDDKTLFAGDIMLHSTFPAVETVRFEIGRDSRELNVSLDKVLELNPEYVVPGHGRLLMGRDDIIDVTMANRDITEFMIDQVDRYYLNDYSADQMIDRVELPPKLAAHPDLQPHYHRVEWMIKTMYLKRAGFVGESMDYVTLTNNQEATRLTKLLGGTRKVRLLAQKALDNDDPRWAARLATYALETDPSDASAKSIRQAAFTRIARTTVSANERNYLLTIIREENGELDWAAIFSKGNYEVIAQQDVDTVLAMMKSRFRAENANGVEVLVKVSVSGAEDRYYRVRNNVLILSDSAKEKPDASLSLQRDTLDRIAANMTSWADELAAGNIAVEEGRPLVETLASLIE